MLPNIYTSHYNSIGNCLHKAAISNNLNDIRKYSISHPEHVNTPDKFGNTPLHYAVANHNIHAVNHLVNLGGSLTSKNHLGQVPKEMAQYDHSNFSPNQLIKVASTHLPRTNSVATLPSKVAPNTHVHPTDSPLDTPSKSPNRSLDLAKKAGVGILKVAAWRLGLNSHFSDPNKYTSSSLFSRPRG
jgi:ankyrin repeat protein